MHRLGFAARLSSALLVLSLTTPRLASAADDPQAAKQHLASAAKAMKDKSYALALTEYTLARAAQPGAEAALGVARADEALGKSGDAYDAYNDALKTFGSTMKKADKTAAEAKLKELGQKTGTISIHVNEEGAKVLLDDHDLGPGPAPALLRADVGPHRVHVEKEGFLPFDSSVTVTAGGRAIVEVTLQRQAKTGHVVVNDTSGKNMRVLVDGIDVGASPWEGDLPPGHHTIGGRNATANAQPQDIDVKVGSKTTVGLVATSAVGHVEVTTSDGQGSIFVDDKPVGDGSYAGELPIGPHKIVVKRAGFESFEKHVDLQERETIAESVTLRAAATSGDASEGSTTDQESVFSGVYGGVGLTGFIEPNGNGNSLETGCTNIGATSCSTPPPVGFGLFGYGGYSWNPIGLELFLGATFDEATPSADYSANSALGSVVGGPPRNEQFILPRLGGVVAVRARATLDGRYFRLSFSAGPGLAYKEMFLVRKAQSQDGTNRQGKEVSEGVSYVSPALVGDLSAHVRVTPGFALSGGVLVFVENAGTTNIDTQNQIIGNANGAAPLRSYNYATATGTQFFIGPYIGVEFGP